MTGRAYMLDLSAILVPYTKHTHHVKDKSTC
nr:MAG TPA: hypothetical protein [Caudoviricetes sp.]